MNVILRTPKGVIEAFRSEAASDLAIVTDGYVVTKFTDLSLFHTGPCRVRVRTAKTQYDYYSENLFCYNSDNNTLLIFLEENHKPFVEALRQLPTKNRRKLLALTDGMNIYQLIRLGGKYGSINLVNAIKQTAWQQTLDISTRYSPKEK